MAAQRGDESRPFDLATAIKHAGFSVNGLARHLEIDKRTVRRWLSGETFPGRDNLSSLAKALHVSETKLKLWAKPRRLPPKVTEYDPRLSLIGANFRAARRLVGLSQKQTAALAGVSFAIIANIELGGSVASDVLKRSQDVIRRELARKAERDKRNQAQRERRALRRQQDRASGVSSTG